MPTPSLKATIRIEYDSGEGGLLVLEHAARRIPIVEQDGEDVAIARHSSRVFHVLADAGLLQA